MFAVICYLEPKGKPSRRVSSLCFSPPPGMEAPQGVGGLREVLPEDQAPVVLRAAAAARHPADQRVRPLPRAQGPAAAARPLLHPPPGAHTHTHTHTDTHEHTHTHTGISHFPFAMVMPWSW